MKIPDAMIGSRAIQRDIIPDPMSASRAKSDGSGRNAFGIATAADRVRARLGA